MTTNYHTPIVAGASNAVATINTPLAALDSAISNVAALVGTGNVRNVQDSTYGATGDGTTDDTAAIQAAIDAAAGGIVFFPAGVYQHTGLTITNNNRITLLGVGPGAWNNSAASINDDGGEVTLLRHTGVGPAIHVYKAGTGYSVAPGYVRIEGMSIVGNANTSHLIFLDRVPRGTVLRNLQVSAHQNNLHGIGIESFASWPLVIENVYVRHGSEAQYASSTGNAQTATATTITLKAGSSDTDGYYVDWTVTIDSGTGSGQSKTITNYDGDTKIATVNTAWTTTPVGPSDSVYTVSDAIPRGTGWPTYDAAVTGTAQGSTDGTITLAAGASSTDDIYIHRFLTTTGGTGSGQVRRITGYNGTTKKAKVDKAWGTAPAGDTTYSISSTSTGLKIWNNEAADDALVSTVTAVADAGGGAVTVTTTEDHEMVAGDRVTIAGTTDYNATYYVSTVPSATTFTVTATYVSSQTGTASKLTSSAPTFAKKAINQVVVSNLNCRFWTRNIQIGTTNSYPYSHHINGLVFQGGTCEYAGEYNVWLGRGVEALTMTGVHVENGGQAVGATATTGETVGGGVYVSYGAKQVTINGAKYHRNSEYSGTREIMLDNVGSATDGGVVGCIIEGMYFSDVAGHSSASGIHIANSAKVKNISVRNCTFQPRTDGQGNAISFDDSSRTGYIDIDGINWTYEQQTDPTLPTFFSANISNPELVRQASTGFALGYTNKTSDYQINGRDNGLVFANGGASGAVKFTLPAYDYDGTPTFSVNPFDGMRVRIIKMAAQDVKVIAGSSTGTAQRLDNMTPGSSPESLVAAGGSGQNESLELLCRETSSGVFYWVVTASYGTWTRTNP